MELAADALKRPNAPWLWRLVATGLSFALFGIGGLCLRVLVFPLLALLPGDAITQRRRARQTVSRLFWLFVQFMYRSGVLTYEVEGAERLGSPGQLIIANHPSLIDVVVLIALIRDANCVVKQSLWDNPFTRGPIRAAQYISNNGSAEMLDEAADALQQGQTLIIFPEGTRTTPRSPPAVPSRSGGHRAARRAAGDAGGDQRDTDHPDQGRTLVPHPLAALSLSSACGRRHRPAGIRRPGRRADRLAPP
ncbi:1-acyl-sn-glycerol-3-phosphate acyltransferase [Stutzerimonas stutzeri]|nr:1-acyl-sn-glycerol-3-phosphate acyltransferase [Stutzerimonas stutzeri]MDH0083858.1 1-acyl-sn-glycerol-3-phosphate acyltransferase [Stutzerimonas stutzeri]RFF63318.1 1-acyl-sn-glycerol-3-phosphate acyltransferase [Stutzerimonas stutzeri]